MEDYQVKNLRETSQRIRKLLLNLHFNAKSGHVGSAVSCLELLVFVRMFWMKHGDTIVLSKGHAASALYSTLAVAGDLVESELIESYYKDGTLFAAHPPPNKLNKIPFATGSLGHGPGVCVGLALGSRLMGSKPDKLVKPRMDPLSENGSDSTSVPYQSTHEQRIFCIVSDGELNEGSVWEAFAFASHFKLKNLIIIIDKNDLQGFGRTTDVLDMGCLKSKFEAFGFGVVSADGHDFNSLIKASDLSERLAEEFQKPTVIIAETTKGRGLPGLVDTVACHYIPLSLEVFEQALRFGED